MSSKRMCRARGKYTVWIDPVHDFHIARVQVRRKTGDRIWNQVVQENETHKELFEVLEFQKIEDVWFPKTCKIKQANQPNDYHATEEKEISFSRIILNPDHDALGPFLPDDIPDGTKALLGAFPPDKEFIWQDGKVHRRRRQDSHGLPEKSRKLNRRKTKCQNI